MMYTCCMSRESHLKTFSGSFLYCWRGCAQKLVKKVKLVNFELKFQKMEIVTFPENFNIIFNGSKNLKKQKH
jgi:hypothetical protein